MNAVAEIRPNANRQVATVAFDQQCRLAESFAASGLFGLKNADQALALMALCEAEGLHPAIAVRDYHIISGKPALKADAMMARFQAAGGRVEWHKLDDDCVDATFSHPAGGSARISWDKARVKQAQLGGNAMHSKYPRQMLRARVVSEGIRTVFPGVVIGVYTPEEVQDFDDSPRKEKDITPPPAKTDEHAKPAYPADKFDQNLPAWTDLIATGKKTHAAVIAMLESKFTVSEEQKTNIKRIEVAP